MKKLFRSKFFNVLSKILIFDALKKKKSLLFHSEFPQKIVKEKCYFAHRLGNAFQYKIICPTSHEYFRSHSDQCWVLAGHIMNNLRRSSRFRYQRNLGCMTMPGFQAFPCPRTVIRVTFPLKFRPSEIWPKLVDT